MAILFGNNLANNDSWWIGTVAADNIFGAGGNDILSGLAGNDTINGDSGNDSLNGGLGQNYLYGGEGNDTLNAFDLGIDDLFGGIGDDVYIVSTTNDNVVEGFNQGIDIVWSSVTYVLDDYVENLLLTGAAAAKGIGNDLGNVITGNSANNTLSGLGGKDTVNGGGGNDTVYGGGDSDTVNGEAGNDLLTGGPSSDKFFFNTALATAGVDRITDFSISSDKIILAKSVFSALEPPAGIVLLASDFESINAPATIEFLVAISNPKEIVYNRETGNLFYNPNGVVPGYGAGGGKFATLVGSPDSLSHTDFTVTV
jgi:Ca2+-binding RTX toxin-like protein